MAPNYNYYGGHNQQTQQQPYTNYPTQRPSSTGATGQYPSSHVPQPQPAPAPQSYSSYSAQAYAPSATSYNLQDYSYGTPAYGASSSSAGTARNTASTDHLQNLAYASVLHNSSQRAPAQSAATASPQTTAAQSQQASVAYDTTVPPYTNASYSAYGRKQSRPKSVNSLVGNTSQRSPVVDARQPSRSGLPLPTYQGSGAQSSSSSQQRPQASQQVSNTHQSSAMQQTPGATQTPEHSRRTLPNVIEPAQTTSTTASYQLNEQHPTQPGSLTSRNYETVNPMQVYDPYPEMQRREAARAAKALEERGRLEKETAKREAEEAQKAQENRQAEEARKAEEERNFEEQRQGEEQRKAQEAQQAEQVIQAQQAPPAQGTNKSNKSKKANTKSKMSKATTDAAATSVSAPQVDVEAQMRALWAQMRDLNSQDPALLARIWEEERKGHLQPNQSASQAPQSPRPPPKTHAAQCTTPLVPQSQPHATRPPSSPQMVQITAPPARAPQPYAARPSAHQSAASSRQPQPQVPRRHQASEAKAPPSGTTIWPTEKKDQISKAASEWLNAIPENHDNQISPEEICSLLNRNPKYIELCEWLESQGMKVERAAFARALLHAVPDINHAQTLRAKGSMTGLASGAVRPPPPAIDVSRRTTMSDIQDNQARPYSAHPASRPNAVAERLNGHQSSYPPPEQHAQFKSPYFVSAQPGAQNNRQLTITTPPPQVPVAPMMGTRQDSGSRHGSAREDSQKPATKADAARKRNFSEIVDLTILSDDDEPPAKKSDAHYDIAPAWTTPPDRNVFQQQPPDPTGYQPVHSLPAVVHVDEKTRSMDVVQPLNRRNALRRSTYEVKSIARDVLLATGKHPEMRPLNGHLEILRQSFKNVDNTSDLSTLRWDLIDPGDPPPDALKPALTELEDDADNEDDEEEDPVKEPSRAHQHHHQQQQPHITPEPAKRKPGRSPRHSEPTFKLQGYRHTGGADSARTNKPSNRERDRDHNRDRASSFGTPKRQQSPMASGSGSAKAMVGYSAFRDRQYGPDGTPLPKKKGRPVGWRKAIHSKEAQARSAGLSPQPASTPRPGAGPSGLRNVQTSGGVVVIDSHSPSIGSDRTYSVYKCRWEGCAAELHNLETLRKHVFKFHNTKNANGRFPCFWQNCEDNERYMNPRTGKPNGFPIMEDWKDHVEFAHLGPKAWELGDGHAGGLSESHDSASEYLSDRDNGRVVTPRILAPLAEKIEVPVAAPGPRPLGRPKLKTDEQKAQEALVALVRKKKLIGPGIDRGGARLANDKRRMGFIDDEDFEEVVSDSN